jgi:hypothetical protein
MTTFDARVENVEATLEPRLVISDKLAGKFFIAAYQRGYRWGEPEVIRLLDDIKSSVIDAPTPENYFLQPVVVLRRDTGAWELVDGQQRLTTLYLIVKFLRNSGHLPTATVNYSLTYETRDSSREYLESLDPERRGDNIDFHHIYAAYEAIGAWFNRQSNRLQAAIDFHSALTKWVNVIWYEAPAGTDPTELFTRLNVGRIPLTDAELIKALVLSKSGARGGRSDRQEQIAAQWDAFERDLQDPELWSFVTGSDKGRPTHIDLIFETLAGEPGGIRPRFWTFERLRPEIEESVSTFWDRVVKMHGILTGWFDDRELHHRVGYLIATGDSFPEIVNLANGLGGKAFRRALVGRIQRRLSLNRSAFGELNYENTEVCRNILLLMNVETVLRRDEDTERFSFRAFATNEWSVEHIHAQNAARLTRGAQWTTWLELHRRAIKALPGRSEEDNADIFERIDDALISIDADKFGLLEREILELFAVAGDIELGEDVHRLPNLALLTRGHNSALGNSVFEVKRQEILRMDKAGAYVPPCTRNAFLKYYTDDADQQLYVWGPQDREAYYAEMLRMIDDYLVPEADQDEVA